MELRSPETLWPLLLTRASELTGAPARNLVDDEGDVHLADTPVGVWARLQTRASGETRVVFVVIPLMELEPSKELDATVRSIIPAGQVVHEFGSSAIQLFGPMSADVLDAPESFREAFDRMLATGKQVLADVQPRHGGLTPEQCRILRGWRGVNDEIEAALASTANVAGSSVLAHGWNPRRESPPLLCYEDLADRAWARRFVTLEKDGGVRLRSTIPGVRDGARGFALTVHRLAPDAARAWAERLGVRKDGARLEVEDVRSLAGRPWGDLWQAMDGLPREEGDGWQEAR